MSEIIRWSEQGVEETALWRSESGMRAPRRLVPADDRMRADVAYRLACEGTALLWRGDFHNARQLLAAIGRRAERAGQRKGFVRQGSSAAEAFHLHRREQARRARVLGMVLVVLESDYGIALRRAPDVRRACEEAYAPARGRTRFAVTLRELLGVVGAHQWRVKGVEIPGSDGLRIHPHYGVFSPVRNEYVELVARAPLPSPTDAAFDIGTGTGVLAAVLARRGVRRVVATDTNPRALACAGENIARLGLGKRVAVVEADLFPPGQAELVVCNPPWVPARPTSVLEEGVYDPDSRMLRGYLDGLTAHLAPGGEGWLILSDLAERLGLRTREELTDAIAQAGLRVADRLDTKPRHPRAGDPNDPLHAARSAEITSLWRLTRDADVHSPL